jgi:hypothetical protein
MPDYTDSAQAVIKQFQGAASSISTDKSPDDAARAFELEQASGVPAESISQDIPSFEAWHKAQLAQGIVNDNPHIAEFVNAHPLHGQLIADDLGNLDKYSKTYKRLFADSTKAFVGGFQEGLGPGALGTEYPNWLNDADRYPIATAALAPVGIPLEAVGRTFRGFVAGSHKAIQSLAQGAGMSEQESTKLANDLAGMIEYQLMKPEAKFFTQKGKTTFEYPAEGEILPKEKGPDEPLPKAPETIEGETVDLSRRGFLQGSAAVVASKATPKGVIERFVDKPQKNLSFLSMSPEERTLRLQLSMLKDGVFPEPGAVGPIEDAFTSLRQEITAVRPFLEAGEKPPYGVSDIADQIHEEASKRSHEISNEVFDAKEGTALAERSPDKFHEFTKSLPKGFTRIQIGAFDKVGPKEFDWIDGLESKLALRPASITVPTNDFFAKTSKETWKEIEEFVAHGDDLTPKEIEEAKEGKQPIAPADELQTIRQAGGLEPAKDRSLPNLASRIQTETVAAGLPTEQAEAGSKLLAARYTARAAKLGVDSEELIRQDSNISIRQGEDKIIKDGRSFEQRASAPTFYSAVEKAVISAKQEKASSEQWLGMLKNMPGVKPEEMEWLGLVDWLKEQKGAVTKQQIADYVRANQIEVKEVEKGGPPDLEMATRFLRGELNGDPAKFGFDTPEKVISEAHRRGASGVGTRYGPDVAPKLSVPGGENYRELLLTLPSKRPDALPSDWTIRQEPDGGYYVYNSEGSMVAGGSTPTQATSNALFQIGEGSTRTEGHVANEFRSSHFDEPNILAHVRFNDRVIDGKKTLLVEEVQSDWHQKGKREGYRPKNLEELKARRREIEARWDDATAEEKREWADIGTKFGEVPDAPFKTTWPGLAMKRMIRYAAENGYDKVAWTTGETQAARYDLSKHVDELRWHPLANGGHLTSIKDGEHVFATNVSREELPDHVGKDVAERLLAQKPTGGNPNHILKGEDLKVGGEGMKGFYDQILPATVNKLAKKFGGKVDRNEITTDALVDRKVPVHTLDITDKLRDTAVQQGFPLFQKDTSGSPQGRVIFQNNARIIELFKSANASTLPHEFSHMWLEEMIADAPRSTEVKTDLDTVLDWLGVEKPEDIETQHHEQFARGFEQYLREGKAPSNILAAVFAKFKAWLTEIYRNVVELGVPISDAMRGVFDRMLASAKDIKTDSQPSPIFSSAKAIGRTNKELSAYDRLIAERDAQDNEWRLARAEKQARKVNSQEWKDEVDRITPEVRDEISSRKEIEAYRFFESVVPPFKRKLKISQDSLTDEQKKVFPAKFSTVKGGYSPDTAASLFGFDSGDDLVASISALDQEAASGKGDILDRLVKAEVDRRVQAKLGESAKERLDEVYDHALSITQMEQLHEQMLRLGTQVGAEISISPMATKIGALNLLHQETFGGVSSNRFLKDSGRFARKLEKALLANDPVEAFKNAQANYISAEMAKEARQVEKETKIFDRIAKRYQSREVEGRDPAYTNWVHDILSRIDEGTRARADIDTEINASSEKTLDEFVKSRAALGREIYMPEFLLDPSFKKPLEEMSTLQARQTMRAIRSLDKVSRDENRLEVAGQKRDRKVLLDQMVAQLESLGPATVVESKPGAFNKLRSGGRTYLAATIQVESILNRWDRGDAFGVFNQWVGRPLIEAANYESTLQKEIASDYKKLPGQISREKLNTSIPNTIFRDPGDAWQSDGKFDFTNAEPIPFTRRHLRAVILNAGNVSNLDKLAKGYGIEPAAVMDWLNTYAKKEDWDWAQAHGKIFEKLKGLSDTMRRNLSGIAPENIPLEPIQIKFGTYEGWYHPVIYDPIWRGERAKPSLPKDLFEGDNPWSRANTPAAYTKERTNYVAPIDLSLDQVPARFTQEIHDIAFHQPVVNASKIFYDSRFLNAVTKYYGRTYSNMFQPWLKDIANARNYTGANQAAAAKWLNYFRTNMVGALVGFNPGTIEKHTITALANSLREVGLQDFLDASRSLYNDSGRGDSNWAFAMDKSEELQRRHQNFMETVSGSQETALEGRSLRKTMLQLGTTPVAMLDLASAVPTWLAAYKQAIEGGKPEGDAVFFADRAVRRAHGSTAITSRPAVMRDYPSVAFLYNFMSRMAQYQYEYAWKARDILTGQAEGKKAEWSKDIMLGMFISVFFVGLVETLVSDVDEKDTFESVAGKSLTAGVAAPWVIAREAVHAMTHKSDPMLGIGSGELKMLTDLYRDVTRKDFGLDKARLGKTVKHANNMLGLTTGVTNAEIGNLLEYLIDINSGKAKPKAVSDWWRGIRRGVVDKPTSEERALRLITGGRR